MKNVVVVSIGNARYAFELRWVREIFSLGYVTVVPNAPPALAGLVNYHGAITPVVDVAALDGLVSDEPGGHSAVLIQVEDVRCAVRIDAVNEVSTLWAGEPGTVTDSTGTSVRLCDPPQLLARIMRELDATPSLAVLAARTRDHG